MRNGFPSAQLSGFSFGRLGAESIEGWVAAMKGDNRAIFRAASEAQMAVDFILAEAGRNEAEQAA